MDEELRRLKRSWLASGDLHARERYFNHLERREGVRHPARREEARKQRAALSCERRAVLDEAFYAAFVRATTEGDRQALTDMRMLLSEGAGTDRFQDYELGPANFGSVVMNWLGPSFRPPTSDADMLKALRLCVEAGPAFLSNRGYVGNGGMPAIWFVFEWLAEPEEERAPVVFELLEVMCEAAEGSSPFWGAFVDAFLFGFLRPLGRAGVLLSETQRKAARLGLNRVLDPADPGLGKANWSASGGFFDDPTLSLFQALIGLADPGLFDIVLSLAVTQAGLFRGSPAALSFETAEPFLNSALGNGRSRAALGALIRRSKWLRDMAFTCPALFFSLVRRRERKLIKILLGLDLQRMRALRDDEGNDLLLTACAAKGRTEKLVELLLQRGFDPALQNARGDRAIDLATQARNHKLIALLSTP